MATAKTIIKTLQWLLEQDNCKAKGTIKYALFINQTEPEYAIGSIVRFTAPGHRVWEQRVENMTGTIVDITYSPRMYDGQKTEDKFGYLYVIEATFFDGKNRFTTKFYIQNRKSSTLITKRLRKSAENFIRHPAGLNYTESIDA